MKQSTHQTTVQVMVLVLAIAAVLMIQCRSTELTTLKGTLRYPMYNIGGEGSSTKLVTTDGVYDLFFDAAPDRAELHRLDGTRVQVVGMPYTARGLERREYTAITVAELSPAEGSYTHHDGA